MKRAAILPFIVLLLLSCIEPNSVTRIHPDVSMVGWTQAFIGPDYDEVEVTWQVSEGFPEEVGGVDATFRIICSDSTVFDLSVLQTDVYGPGVVKVYTHYLDVVGKQATGVSIRRVHFR